MTPAKKTAKKKTSSRTRKAAAGKKTSTRKRTRGRAPVAPADLIAPPEPCALPRRKPVEVELFPDHTDVALLAVEAARKAGATDADAYVATGRKTSVKVREGEIEELTQAGSKAMGIRALVGGRSAVLYTSDFSRQAVRRLAADAVALARHSGEDPFAGLPPPTAANRKPPRRLPLLDPSIPEEPLEAKVDRALRCEAAAEKVDRKIKNTQGTGYSDHLGAVAYASSNGFVGRYEGSYCSLHTIPIAVLRGKRQTDYWSSSARFLEDLDEPEDVGRIAAMRSLARLGGEVPRTEELPVVFDPPCAATILSHFAAAASGSAVYQSATFLEGLLGKKLAAAGFTVVDDATLPCGLGSRPFDGEGLPSKKLTIFDKGTLKRYLTDSYAARKLKKPRTHSAGRSVRGGPGVTTTNLYLVAGKHSPEKILASVKRGVYVTSFMGHGVNLVTGDYSRGATGFLIEDGELTRPLQGFTIASNLKQMLKDVSMIGSDLCFRSAVNAPTIKLRSMTIGGK